MITVLLPLILVSSPIQADKAAHFGLSYAATHACQVAVKKVFDTSKLTSTLTCVSVVLAAGVAKEIADPYMGGQRDGNDLLADVAGIGFAVTIISIDW